MSEFQGTPGPWEYKTGNGGWFTVFVSNPKGDLVIAHRSHWEHNVTASHANARLIAAAPTMLDKLVEIAARLESASVEVDCFNVHESLALARDAIAKATS